MLFPGKLLIITLAALSAFGLALGFLHINPDHTRCQDGKTWTSTQWRTIFAVSKLEWRYRDWNYDCKGEKYDPRVYQQYP